jgi:hypothetical protein
MKEKEMIPVSKYEFETTRSFELGIGSGWEYAGKFLLERAIEFFERKDDTTATLLRKFSEEISEKGKKLAETARGKKEAE